MFWNRKKVKETETKATIQSKPIQNQTHVDFTMDVTQEEIDAVSIIASAILSEDQSDASMRVVSVRGVDQDKEAAAIIAASVLAHDRPESVFRLVSIRESEGRK